MLPLFFNQCLVLPGSLCIISGGVLDAFVFQSVSHTSRLIVHYFWEVLVAFVFQAVSRPSQLIVHYF